jgi:probable phosphomutase (TIGR03848 family)
MSRLRIALEPSRPRQSRAGVQRVALAHAATSTSVRKMPPKRPLEPRKQTLLVMVRHGLTPTTGKELPGRARGLHLSEEGKRQAEIAAERVAQLLALWRHPHGTPSLVGGVYSSPLERARETAAPIAKALGCNVSVERSLIECDYGEWTGKKLADLRKKAVWERLQRWPSGFRFPAGESFSQMQARVNDTVVGLCDKHQGQLVVAVSHADVIKAAVVRWLGAPLDMVQRITISPCSLTAAVFGDSGPRVLMVNQLGEIGWMGSLL